MTMLSLLVTTLTSISTITGKSCGGVAEDEASLVPTAPADAILTIKNSIKTNKDEKEDFIVCGDGAHYGLRRQWPRRRQV